MDRLALESQCVCIMHYHLSENQGNQHPTDVVTQSLNLTAKTAIHIADKKFRLENGGYIYTFLNLKRSLNFEIEVIKSVHGVEYQCQ